MDPGEPAEARRGPGEQRVAAARDKQIRGSWAGVSLVSHLSLLSLNRP